MGVPHQSGQFGDLLDPRFQQIFHEEKDEIPSMLGEMYSDVPNNGRADIRWSDVGAYTDFVAFTGNVTYQSATQGYDTTATYLEFASGIQVERKLFDDDQYHIMNQRPQGLAMAAARTREKHGARMPNNAFSNDTFFYNNSEGVALCSNSHTTNAQGISTSTGFDNLATGSMTAGAVASGRIQMRGFRDDVGNRFSVSPDELWYPPDLFERAWEIVSSQGKLDTSNNNRNVHEGRYTLKEWDYMTDTNNWFMVDSRLRRMYVMWIDRIGLEFAFAEDLDTIIAKWRAYMRYAMAFTNWRWVLGHQVG